MAISRLEEADVPARHLRRHRQVELAHAARVALVTQQRAKQRRLALLDAHGHSIALRRMYGLYLAGNWQPHRVIPGCIARRFVRDPGALREPLNALHLVFHPELMRPYLEDWPTIARTLLAQLQRESLGRPTDDGTRELVGELCAYPGVPGDWRQPALDLPAAAALEFGLLRDGIRARFLTTLTVFNAPLDAGLEDLRLESYFPVDEATEALCRAR
jgi:hypothetical protein